MDLYRATGDRQWLDKAKVQAAHVATWTLSYDYYFPPNSDLGKLKVHAAGAYFASTQNKHAAPGICTSPGDYLFKLYCATSEHKYAELILDIQHAHTEVDETPGCPTVSTGAGVSRSQMSEVIIMAAQWNAFSLLMKKEKMVSERYPRMPPMHGMS